MRSAVLIALLALPAPASAQEEQEELEEFAEVERDLDDVWTLDDGAGDDLVWNDYDPSAEYAPRGMAHLGVQLRVGGLFGGGQPLTDGGLGDLSVFFDLRYAQRGPIRLRIALAFSAQTYGERNAGSGTWEASSPFALRARVYPVSVDITDWIVLRPAVELGAQWTERPDNDRGEWAFFFGLTGEAMLRLLEGSFEVGLFGGFQLTAVGVTSRGPWHYHRMPMQGALGLTAAWMFL
jgi:hypothetical protein